MPTLPNDRLSRVFAWSAPRRALTGFLVAAAARLAPVNPNPVPLAAAEVVDRKTQKNKPKKKRPRPLAAPNLAPNQQIRREYGLVNNRPVDRYTWRDASGQPRSVSLLRPTARASGYAIQFTYRIDDDGGDWRTVAVNPSPGNNAAGFGYFVSHENERAFTGNPCRNGVPTCTIASLHGEDDSPLGRYLPGTGRPISLTANQAVHEFKQNYPHWGTVNPIADINSTPTPGQANKHRKYAISVTIRWTMTAGRDYPLWSATYDFSRIGPNRVSVDVRGPYGSMTFDETDEPLTALEWGDVNIFKTTGGSVTTQSNWTWNTPNHGARYNLLVAGDYEMGLVEAVPYSASTSGVIWAEDNRGFTSANGAGCTDPGWRMPCDWEWPYQSIQYEDFGPNPTSYKKLAWGSAFYAGTTRHQDDIGAPFTGYPRISYRLWITLDHSGGAKTRALAASIQ